MNLYTTADIEIIDENLTKMTDRARRKLQNDLQEAFATAADVILEQHGITNGLWNTVMVNEIEIDDSGPED